MGEKVRHHDELGGVRGRQRPSFPKRAVVTGGMPYGNKTLHFGHVGGVFVHADIYSRFLRDRIGAENVVFVSGTDCYGATIEAGYEAMKASGFSGTIEDYVEANHRRQLEVLESYEIKPDLYGASALGEAGRIHSGISQEIFNTLYGGGYLSLMETMQFFDEEQGVFLNGRQVVGRCPIQGCKSEFAYADECSLGHQYSPSELIAPVSALTGKRPVLRGVRNWFFDLMRFGQDMWDRQKELEADPATRKYLVSVIEEFLRQPMVYIKKEQMETVEGLRGKLPPFTVVSEENKTSDALVFETLDHRQAACKTLDEAGIRYRTGKTLVPFRLSGNVAWGIPAPSHDGEDGLTFWVWPESLWAPISFTKACLKQRGLGENAWQDWWASDEARVYQFIGEDNIYFYSVAQTGLFLALKAGGFGGGDLQLTHVVPNRHVLYQNKKASSSSAKKPPMAEDLLEFYTPEQLRMHFFHLNLAVNSASFDPKAITAPEAKGQYDPVLYEGNILTNIYNRLIRSCFYCAQKYYDGRLPEGIAPSAQALERGEDVILAYEEAMYRFEFGKVVDLLDAYLREANKEWAAKSKEADTNGDEALRASILADSFHAVRVAATLLHPLAPEGTQVVRDYLQVDERLWQWEHIFEPLTALMEDPARHTFRFLEPRVDFFKKHESQL